MTAHDLELGQVAKVLNIERTDLGLIVLNRGVMIGSTIKKIRNVSDTYYVDISGYPFIFTGLELKTILVESNL